MKIGCVKEIKNNEFRVGLTPDNVKTYLKNALYEYGRTDDVEMLLHSPE